MLLERFQVFVAPALAEIFGADKIKTGHQLGRRLILRQFGRIIVQHDDGAIRRGEHGG